MNIVSEQINLLFSEENIAPTAHVFSQTIGNGTLAQFTIVHAFNTSKVLVQVVENNAEKEVVYADVEIINNNAVTVSFSEPPSLNQYTVIIIGG